VAVDACHPVPRAVVIGLGYRSQQRVGVVAGLVVDSLAGAEGFAIRITSETLVLAAQPGSNGAAEVDHAARLAALPGIIGVVGHGGSREALMTAPIYNEAHIPQIVPTGTSRRLRKAGEWTFMLAPDDSAEGEFLGGFVAGRLHARTATVFYVLDEYGAGLRDGAVTALTRRGVRVLDVVPVDAMGECLPVAPGNSYAAAVDAALLRGRPDVVVLATRQRESGCIVARVHRRYPGVLFAAGDGLTVNRDFSLRAGAAGDSTYVVAFWHRTRPDSISRAFVRRYECLFGATPKHDEAMVYDALYALAEAVRTVGPDGEHIRRYLMSLGRTRPPLAGVTGPIMFPGSASRLLMTRVHGEAVAVVAP
jgi:ABC-type branched-subunit amino acid transport system substrate-binding protein